MRLTHGPPDTPPKPANLPADTLGDQQSVAGERARTTHVRRAVGWAHHNDAPIGSFGARRACGCAGHDGHDPEAELVDQVVSQERVVEVAGAVFDEVLAGLVLQLGGRAGWVGPEEGGIPQQLGRGGV